MGRTIRNSSIMKTAALAPLLLMFVLSVLHQETAAECSGCGCNIFCCNCDSACGQDSCGPPGCCVDGMSPEESVDNCCSEKIVGNITYTLLPGLPDIETHPKTAKNGCIYTVKGDPSGHRYAFEPGHLPFKCKDEKQDGITTATHQTSPTQPPVMTNTTGFFYLNASCDNILRVYLDGVLAFGPETDLYKAHTVPVPASTRVIGISCYDQGGGYGIVASADNGRIVTDYSWSCSSKELSGWATIGFDDKGGDFLTPSRGNIYNQGSHSSYAAEPPVGIDQNAHSLWGPTEHGWAFCRKILEAIQQTSTTPAPVMTNIAGCIDGWSAFGSNCYKYFEASLTWQNAENQCKLEGGHLASIHSKEENDFIKSITTPKWFWIGLTDFTEGVWVWSDGSPFSFSNWSGSGPSNSGGNEDCTHGTQEEPGSWNDVNCASASVLGFVCKT